MTPGEHRLLAFLRQYLADNDGVSPTYMQMAEALGLRSKSGIHRMVISLEAQGRVSRTVGKQNSVAIVGEKVERATVCPHCGGALNQLSGEEASAAPSPASEQQRLASDTLRREIALARSEAPTAHKYRGGWPD